MPQTDARRCIPVRGSPEDTAARACALLGRFAPERVLWVGGGAPGERGPSLGQAQSAARVRRLLGASFDAVVLDLHEGLDPDLLGQCEGFIRGGGALLLRLPPRHSPPPRGSVKLAAWPYRVDDVTCRTWRRFLRAVDAWPEPREGAEALVPPTGTCEGTAEQAALVSRLVAEWTRGPPQLIALLADRGRGKSSALGMAIGALPPWQAGEVLLTGPQPACVEEIRRFAQAEASRRGHPPAELPFADPLELLSSPVAPRLLVIDEAAQLPVPVLAQLALRFPDATLAFATTTRGYEGTGRGFVLRFLAWAEQQARPLLRLRLRAPIRFAEDDPLERWVHRVLLLDAAPAPLKPRVETSSPAGPSPAAAFACRHELLDRDRLADDERLLAELFGLLVHAHYRTTPGDLLRALDAPNVQLHALLQGGHVAAACLVAQEGALPAALAARVRAGKERLRGHALPETLLWHCARIEAGPLAMLRSVRIATHPDARRQGLASALVHAVHAHGSPDAFGTLFGVTPELLRFRRGLGYELVRVGSSRGARSGEPAVAMIRAVTPPARALLADLRAELALSLPVQLSLLAADSGGLLDEETREALLADLPDARPLAPEETEARVAHYLESPQPFEAVAYAIRPWIEQRATALDALPRSARALIEHRALRGDAWLKSAREAGLADVPAAMKGMRSALRLLRDAAGG